MWIWGYASGHLPSVFCACRLSWEWHSSPSDPVQTEASSCERRWISWSPWHDFCGCWEVFGDLHYIYITLHAVRNGRWRSLHCLCDTYTLIISFQKDLGQNAALYQMHERGSESIVVIRPILPTKQRTIYSRLLWSSFDLIGRDFVQSTDLKKDWQ